MTKTKWNCASREQKNQFAEDAGLLRRSAFTRDLPCWHELPVYWQQRLGALEGESAEKKGPDDFHHYSDSGE